MFYSESLTLIKIWLANKANKSCWQFFFSVTKKNIFFPPKNCHQPSVILVANFGSFFFWANYGIALDVGPDDKF